ncbi:hypothetical protein [Shimia gijangensis]|nr:hypothetical protein [Shimia gijangensis]
MFDNIAVLHPEQIKEGRWRAPSPLLRLLKLEPVGHLSHAAYPGLQIAVSYILTEQGLFCSGL